MRSFRKGDKVRCINDNVLFLEKGKIYTIWDNNLTGSHIRLCEINGYHWFRTSQFEYCTKENSMKRDTILEVDIHTYGNVLFGTVIVQDFNYITRGKSKFVTSNGVEIQSQGRPEYHCGTRTLFVCGNRNDCDDDAFTCRCESPEDAIKQMRDIIEAVDELNQSRRHDEPLSIRRVERPTIN